MVTLEQSTGLRQYLLRLRTHDIRQRSGHRGGMEALKQTESNLMQQSVVTG